MRQEGVRVASGRRQDNLASGWRQEDVKRRGARPNWGVWSGFHATVGFASVRWNHGATHA